MHIVYLFAYLLLFLLPPLFLPWRIVKRLALWVGLLGLVILQTAAPNHWSNGADLIPLTEAIVNALPVWIFASGYGLRYLGRAILGSESTPRQPTGAPFLMVAAGLVFAFTIFLKLSYVFAGSDRFLLAHVTPLVFGAIVALALRSQPDLRIFSLVFAVAITIMTAFSPLAGRSILNASSGAAATPEFCVYLPHRDRPATNPRELSFLTADKFPHPQLIQTGRPPLVWSFRGRYFGSTMGNTAATDCPK